MGTALGTPAYAGPEQAAGRLDEMGRSSDIYSLGATLYCLLTGQKPIEGEKDAGRILERVKRGEFPPPKQVKPDIPRALEAVCLKAMALQAEERYASARDLADDVEHWLADEPVRAWTEPWTVKARRWVDKHRSVVTGAAATLIVGTIGLITATALLTYANEETKNANLMLAEEKRKADNEGVSAEKAEKDALKLAKAADYRLTRLHVANGTQSTERGQPFTALLWYARAWQGDLDQANEPSHRSRIGGVLDGVPRLVGACFHPEGVDDVDINLAGTRLITRTANRSGANGHAVYVWDFVAGKLAIPALTHAGPVRCIGFSPDGSQILTASDDKTAGLWDTAAGGDFTC